MSIIEIAIVTTAYGMIFVTPLIMVLTVLEEKKWLHLEISKKSTLEVTND